MKTARIFLAAALILVATWFTATSTYGFDIAIYSDPLSYLNMRYFWGIYYNGYNGSYDAFMADTGYTANGEDWMEDVYGWYRDMGVTKVMVYYPYPDNFNDNDMAQDCTHIGVMNWFYPGLGTMHGAKYVDAQFRDVQVGNQWPNENGYWSFDSSLGQGAQRISNHNEPNGPAPNQRSVVSMTGSAGTMWRPQSNLGKFSGWDGLQTGFVDSSWFMPMHFKLTWAVDSDEPIDTTQALAYFYWMVHTPNDTMYGYPNCAWWRFPARPIILPTQGQANSWITTEFVDSANAGYYDLLDDNFSVLEDSVPWYDVRFGPADGGFLLVGGTGFQGGDPWASHGMVIRTNEVGDSLWAREYSFVRSFLWGAPDVDGGYLLVYGNRLFKMNDEGDTLWTQTLFPESDYWIISIRPTSDHGFILSADEWPESFDITKISSMGALEWNVSFPAYVSMDAGRVIQTADGGYFGMSQRENQYYGMLVIKLEPDLSIPTGPFIPLPSSVTLSAFPNPFNPSTTLSFSLLQTQIVKLVVYDVTGREIDFITEERYEAGEHKVSFDAAALPSGIYFAHLSSGTTNLTQKLLLLK